MKKGKAILAVLLTIAAAVPLAACAKSNSGTVTISTNAEFEPFEYKSKNQIVGIDIDISNKIADKLGKTLQVRDVPFKTLTNELDAGKCDFVAAGMTVNEDRKKNVDFSDTYFDATQSIIVLKDSAIKARADLNGKKVGVQQGTTGDDFCTNKDGKSDIHVGEVKRYDKAVDAISDLMTGRLDAVIIDDFPAQKFVSKNPDKIKKLDDALTVEHYALAVKKGNTELLKTINEVIGELKSSGELDKIIDKYKTALEGD